jgi:hypothetical protein
VTTYDSLEVQEKPHESQQEIRHLVRTHGPSSNNILTDLAILCWVSGRFCCVSRMQKCDKVNISISILVKLSKKIIALSSLQSGQDKSNNVMEGSAQSFVGNDDIQDVRNIHNLERNRLRSFVVLTHCCLQQPLLQSFQSEPSQRRQKSNPIAHKSQHHRRF